MNYNLEQNVINCLCLANGSKLKSTGISWGPGMRDVYCLCYVTEGQGKLTVDGISFSVSAGQSFLTFPFSNVTIESERHSPWSYRWLEFRGLEVAWIISQTTFSKQRPVVNKMPVENFEDFFKIDLHNDAPYIKCRINSKIMLLLSYYLEYFPCDSAERNSYALMARDYIEKNYRDSDCNVKKVADYIKIDRTYLYRLFKEETGASVIDYINNCRISKAVIMLSDRNISIKDIAFSVGFTDQMYFSRVFKKLRGVTPTEYRRTHTDVF